MAGGRRLFLHVGLPKTASSALQAWAAANRAFLLERGVSYPQSRMATQPKHQELVTGLFSGDLDTLDGFLAGNEAPALFLSTEGLTNHLYDFPRANLDAFRERLAGWRVSAFVVRRDREDWITSYWKQALLNPEIRNFNYATPLERDAFAQLPRVRRLCDIDRICMDVRNLYGATEIILADQAEDWLGALLGCMGIDAADSSLPERVHVSVSDDLAELVRQTNAMGLPSPLRAAFLALVQHVCETRHNTLVKYRADHAPERLAAQSEALVGVLRQLAPGTEGQMRIVDALGRHLSSCRRPARAS